MTEQQFRKIALALDGASEGAHMGHPDFRAHGRIFATLRREPIAFAVVMLTPEQQREFLKSSPCFTPESGAWGRAGCTRVAIAAIDEDTVGEALTLAWRNAAAKAAAKRTKPAGAKKRPAALKRTVRR
jgi:hypothetical protein